MAVAKMDKEKEPRENVIIRTFREVRNVGAPWVDEPVADGRLPTVVEHETRIRAEAHELDHVAQLIVCCAEVERQPA